MKRAALLVFASAALACSSSPGGQTPGADGGGSDAPAPVDAGGNPNDAGQAAPDLGGGAGDAAPPAPDAGGTKDAAPPSPDLGGGKDASTPAPDATSSTGKPTIFYLDVGGRVMTADAENPMPRALVASAGQGPDGIAVDLPNRHIYWTNMGVPADDDGYVRRSNLDGSNVVTLVPAGGTWTPKQMRLEPASGKLYWSDREGMRVQRSNLDGSGLETIMTVATGATARGDSENWCVGIAVDAAAGWFYWTQKGPSNGGVGSIRRAHIAMPAGQTSTTRTDVEVLFSGLPEPIDLELDVEDGMLYWADRGDDTISRAPIAIPAGRTAASRTDREIIVRSVREAIGLVIDKRRGRLYYTGASGQLGRANLDGSGKQELTGAGAMTGIVVVDLP